MKPYARYMPYIPYKVYKVLYMLCTNREKVANLPDVL